MNPGRKYRCQFVSAVHFFRTGIHKYYSLLRLLMDARIFTHRKWNLRLPSAVVAAGSGRRLAAVPAAVAIVGALVLTDEHEQREQPLLARS